MSHPRHWVLADSATGPSPLCLTRPPHPTNAALDNNNNNNNLNGVVGLGGGGSRVVVVVVGGTKGRKTSGRGAGREEKEGR